MAGPGVAVDIYGVDGTPSSSIVVLDRDHAAVGRAVAAADDHELHQDLCGARRSPATRIGLQGTPPTQVLAGLSLFLSLFIMGPVLGEMNDAGIQPYLHGEVSFCEGPRCRGRAAEEFMLVHTRESDIALMTRAAEAPNPDTKADVSMTTLMPAFMLSELRSAFIIGFVIFVPFLVIDLVVAGALMSMGMMMLPPVMVSLPFKLLLFVLVDGWTLIITALIGSYG